MAYKIGDHNIDHRKLKIMTTEAVNSSLAASGAPATSIFTSPFDEPIVRGLVYWNFDDETKTLTFSMRTELPNKIGNKAQFTKYADTPWSAKCSETNVKKVVLLDKITLPYPQYWLPKSQWMMGEEKYTEYQDFSKLDLSQALNLDNMFKGWQGIPKDVEQLNVSAARSMVSMFQNAYIQEDLDLSSWDVDHVLDTHSMFSNCNGDGSIKIFTNTSSVANFEEMFAGCQLKISDIPLMSWAAGVNFKGMFAASTVPEGQLPDVPRGENFEGMFLKVSQESIDLSSWNTKNMSNTSFMFLEFPGSHIYVGAGWDTSKVVEGESMFRDASHLPHYNENQYDVSVAYIGDEGVLSEPPYQIYWAVQEEGTVLRFSKTELDGSVKGNFLNEAPKLCPWEANKADIQKVIFDFKMTLSDPVGGPYYLKDYFNHMPALTSFLPLDGFRFNSINFTEALSGDVKLTAIGDTNFFLEKDPEFGPTESITAPRLSLKNMFYDCRALTSVHFMTISKNSGGVDASSMCRQSGIGEVEFGDNYYLFTCENMFASSLAETIKFKYKFPEQFCSLPGYVNFNYMFYNAKALTEVDLTEAEIFKDGYDTSYTASQADHKFQYIFAGCSALEEVFIMDDEYWGDFDGRDYADHMFDGCVKLRNYDAEGPSGLAARYARPSCPKWEEEWSDYQGYPGYFYAVDNVPSDYNYWKLEEDGVLLISTSTPYYLGQMIHKKTVFNKDNLPPWAGNEKVKRIVIRDMCLPNLDYLFYNLPNVLSIDGFENFKFNLGVYEPTSAVHAFDGCSALTTISFESDYGFEKHPIQSFEYMFKNCEKLKSASLKDVSFYGFSDERGLVGVFYNCKSLIKPDNSWNLSGFTRMSIDYMFFGCESLRFIDLLEIDGAPSAYCAFENCSELEYIGCVPERWEIPGDSTNMFRGCKSLPNFDSNYLNKEKAHRREGGYLSEM